MPAASGSNTQMRDKHERRQHDGRRYCPSREVGIELLTGEFAPLGHDRLSGLNINPSSMT